MMTLFRIYFTLILFSFTTLIHANNEYDAVESNNNEIRNTNVILFCGIYSFIYVFNNNNQ